MKRILITGLILSQTACGAPTGGGGFNFPAFYSGIAVSIGLIILKDVCIMSFLGLHDLSRRIFQSAAI